MSARRFKVTGGSRTFRTNDKTKARLRAKAIAAEGKTSEVHRVLTGKVIARFTPDVTFPMGWREERFE